jgi:hypothetical protein
LTGNKLNIFKLYNLINLEVDAYIHETLTTRQEHHYPQDLIVLISHPTLPLDNYLSVFC